MIKKVLYVLLGALMLASCHRSGRLIGEDELKAIISEALLADVYVSQSDIKRDSIDYFKPIFERYGYTINDFEYTLRRHALRKSSVLGVLLDEISIEFDSLKKIYNYKSQQIEQWNNSAKEHSSKVLYFKDSVKINTHEQLKALSKIKVPAQRSGRYEISFKYTIDSLSDGGTYMLEYNAKDTISGQISSRGRHWMVDRTKDKAINSVIDIDHRKRNLLEYNLPVISKTAGKIIIRFDSLMVRYTPPQDEYLDEYMNYNMSVEDIAPSITRDAKLLSIPYQLPSDSIANAIFALQDSLTTKVKGLEIKPPYKK